MLFGLFLGDKKWKLEYQYDFKIENLVENQNYKALAILYAIVTQVIYS
jgi:hypothetical protein